MTNSSDSSNNLGGEVILEPPSVAKKKQISCAKHWCFTHNNPTKEVVEFFSNIDSSIVPIIVFQEEEESTKHLQGCISFKTKGRPFNLFRGEKFSGKTHWEPKGKYSSLDEMRFYCCDPQKRMKDGIVYMRGYTPPVKYVCELQKFYKWEEDIINLLKTTPDDRSIYWYWENNGCRGKTTFCKYIFTHFEKVVTVSGKASDMKNCIVSYLDKNKYLPVIVLVNIPRSKADYVSYEGIESIKDMFFYSGKYEGGMVCGANPHVIVMGNSPPEMDKLSIDRWCVVEI